MNRNIQSIEHQRFEDLKKILLLAAPFLIGITVLAYLDNRDWTVIFIPVASLILASPVWLLVRRQYKQYYYEDAEHFETITRLLHRKVYMRFEDIAHVSRSYNPVCIWIMSKDGNRIELSLNRFAMPQLLSYLKKRWDEESQARFTAHSSSSSIFEASFLEPHAAPWRSRLFTPLSSKVDGSFFSSSE
ncbi:MAG: hypothetical protein IJ125_09725 [Atopobiaceae bacterium]|nr:hypothetical protein [Atopobiaceae bacterium]